MNTVYIKKSVAAILVIVMLIGCIPTLSIGAAEAVETAEE